MWKIEMMEEQDLRSGSIYRMSLKCHFRYLEL